MPGRGCGSFKEMGFSRSSARPGQLQTFHPPPPFPSLLPSLSLIPLFSLSLILSFARKAALPEEARGEGRSAAPSEVPRRGGEREERKRLTPSTRGEGKGPAAPGATS